MDVLLVAAAPPLAWTPNNKYYILARKKVNVGEMTHVTETFTV